MALTITNRGAEIVTTNFWRLGIPHVMVSPLAGIYRVLLPRGFEHVVDEVRGAREVQIRRGLLADRDAIELLFEDGTNAPYAIHTTIEAFILVPAPSEIGRERAVSIWVVGPSDQPQRACQLPCRYLGRVATLPSS